MGVRSNDLTKPQRVIKESLSYKYGRSQFVSKNSLLKKGVFFHKVLADIVLYSSFEAIKLLLIATVCF